MIKLNSQYITTTQATLDGVVTTTVTDTIYVSYVEINFSADAIRAKIQRGTTDTSGNFTPNMSELWVSVNSDGSFTSTDGSISGAAGALNVSSLVGSLGSGLDAAVLSAGVVSGTVE